MEGEEMKQHNDPLRVTVKETLQVAWRGGTAKSYLEVETWSH